MKQILLFSSSLVWQLRCPWDGLSSKNGHVCVPAVIMYTTLNLNLEMTVIKTSVILGIKTVIIISINGVINWMLLE